MCQYKRWRSRRARRGAPPTPITDTYGSVMGKITRASKPAACTPWPASHRVTPPRPPATAGDCTGHP
jgi:hypothetical protein